MQKYETRAEVPEKYKWDLSDFFQNDDEFIVSYEKIVVMIEELKKYNGCTKNPVELYEFLKKEIETIAYWEDLYVYAYLVNDQELGVTESIERKSKTEFLNAELEKNTSFFAPELLKLTKEEYQNLFVEEPRLQEFSKVLDEIYRSKDYTLSESEEKIVAELVNSANHYDDMSSMLLNSEHDYGTVNIDGEKVVIATNNYRFLMKNPDVSVRKKVYMQFNKKLEQYASSSASYLNSYVSLSNSIAKIRNFSSSWDQRLFNLNMPDEVFTTLVKTTEKNVKVLQKYYELKKEILDLDRLHFYDISLSMTPKTKEYSVEEAQKLVMEAIKPLGEEYCNHFAKIIKNRYVDYCQYKGKCSGGYSFATILKNSRILMSYNGELDSVSTFAHEGGHNVHHQFVLENNSMQYRDPASVVAEVCSLTNEYLLSYYLMENGSTKEEKLAGISNIIEVIISNLFGAVREGKIEQEMYEEVLNGGTITKEFMDKKTQASLKKYYGKVVSLDKHSKNGWITRSHYFMNFYLYSYAICISVACSIASSIIKGDKDVLDRYIKFMKTGSDVWPMEAFKILGVDLTKEKVYEDAISCLDTFVSKYKDVYEMEE